MLISKPTFDLALRLTWDLTKAELTRRHAASIGGFFWSFFTPVATVVTIWIAFDYGLGLKALRGAEYGQGLIVGIAVWLFVADAVNNATSSIVANPHFVKKVRFPVALLPISSVLSALVIHVFIVLAAVLFLGLQGVRPTVALLTLPFWMALTLLLCLGTALIAAAANVVLRDVGAMLPALVGLWFWLTPIVWPLDMIPPDWRWVALFNPVTVVVEGYRYAMLGIPLPIEPGAVALVVLAILSATGAAAAFFARLRPVFADAM